KSNNIIRFYTCRRSFWHPGRSGDVEAEGRRLGIIAGKECDPALELLIMKPKEVWMAAFSSLFGKFWIIFG
ncbi:MAG: hypothetical protein ACYTF1_13840, partial [Planctomycetota bacterium]